LQELPPWCRPPAALVGRDQLVEDAVDAALAGPITLAGPPGAGATTAGAAVIQRLVATGRASRAIAIRFDGCSNVSDGIRALGHALDLPMPGDAASVRAALRVAPPVAILLDDADLAPEAARQLLAVTGPSRIVATGREGVLGSSLDVDPLSAQDIAPILGPGLFASEVRGLPLLARLPPGRDPVDPWSTIEHLTDGSELLADIPMGLDDEGTEPPAVLRPYLLPVPGRLVLRRAVREILGAGRRPSAETLAAVVRDRVPELHRIAADADPSGGHEDIVLLRTAAEQIQEPDLRGLAGAAAARMMVRAFQPADAISLTQVLLAIRLPPTARGLLRWVQGDAWLALGSEVEAQAAYLDGARALSASNRNDIAAHLARAAAAQLIARGSLGPAADWLARAESPSVRADREVQADHRRISAGVALIHGDLDGALARLAEASAGLRGSPSPTAAIGRALVALGRATAHLARGDAPRARDQLGRAAEDAGAHPALRGAIALIEGELSAREGDVSATRAAAREALAQVRHTGSIPALGRALRLLGDADALAGDPDGAVDHWREVVRLAVRSQDVPLARAALARIATLEAEGAPGPHVEEAAAQHTMAAGMHPPR
jgi:tetratricopeptide (TPR) repeat protein